MQRIALTFITIFFALSAFSGDILTLNIQMVFNGKVTKIKNGVIVFKSEGTKYLVPATEIYSLEFEDVNDKVYTDYIELASDSTDKCMSGRSDAMNFHGKKGGHFFLGVLFGPFAVIGTALANPTPYKSLATQTISRNKELFDDPEYLHCYRNKAKGQLIGSELLGWGTFLVIVLFVSI